MSKFVVFLLIVVTFLTGCQKNVKPSENIQPEPEVAMTPVIPDSDVSNQSEQITHTKPEQQEKSTPEQKAPTKFEKLTQHLIQQGKQALSEQRLLTPAEDNANLYFQAALGRDPGNFQAIQGIAAIVDTYTQWAWQAARNRDYNKAERYLDSARSVNPGDPMIVEMASRVSDLKAKRQQAAKADKNQAKSEALPNIAKEGQYFLPKTLFSLSDDEIIAKIQPIIDEVAKTDRPIAIYWPNDKEARLIYQIINSRVPEFRVRAMTYHRADYMVELQKD
ncbi:hypothetical protein C0J08_07495 [Marinomonas sp. CT5]|uniref:hypothetical protein n=1 Tax=Marinomonas sp. CT5 TaxID=2066133 RepID=UPI001BAF11F7|nr:hypothetical protein [Marinomonas sp. CT5]QUX95273.1 hypothetical protein C0J08_07495 [Marinomonas sp. CT5]